MEIFNILGKSQGKFRTNINTGIDVSSWRGGIYFIRSEKDIVKIIIN